MKLTEEEKRLITEHQEFFVNTGGNDVIELLERKVDVRINLPVAMMQACCNSQLLMLQLLWKKGRIL